MRRRALIDLDAFVANLNVIGGDAFDARADAYGHGLAILGPAARDTGVRTVRVSNERDADIARGCGLTAVQSLDPGPGVADAAAILGLDGTHRPVLAVVGELIAVKHVPAGAGVSYGYTYRAAAATHLALVGLGYADGIPRLASNRATLTVDGVPHPLVGRIAMDQLVIELGDAPVPTGGDVVVFGDPARGEASARDWADWTERSPLALTAGLGHRIRRETR